MFPVLRLLRKNEFTAEQLNHPARGYAKVFQRANMMDLCRSFHDRSNFCEIGPHDYFNILDHYRGPKIIIDPYKSGGGAGLEVVPANLPYPVTLFRCMLGENSDIIPNDFIDFSFSVSVIEHIGQAEVQYDCNPVENPPEIQERPRRGFCEELFRITRSGGLTVHSVDHAARNLTFVDNFLAAGFELIHADETVTVEECLNAPDAIRQRHQWLDPTIPMSEEEMRLHSVLTMGFVKPS